MSKKLVFLWDSTIEPWSGDVQRIKDYLTKLAEKGFTYELVDTKDMPEEKLGYWRGQALAASVREKQEIRKHFDASQLYLGKQVPALLMYEDGEELAAAVYPHSEKRGETHTDYSIEDFLKELTDSLGG